MGAGQNGGRNGEAARVGLGPGSGSGGPVGGRLWRVLEQAAGLRGGQRDLSLPKRPDLQHRSRLLLEPVCEPVVRSGRRGRRRGRRRRRRRLHDGCRGRPAADASVPADSLIKNGDFSLGGQDWKLEFTSASPASSAACGRYCIQNQSASLYASFSLSYPTVAADAFAIDPGATYTLSYRVAGTGLANVTARIGHAEALGYVQLYASMIDYPKADGLSQVFTHQVSSSTGGAAETLTFDVALDVAPNTFCFYTVALVKN